MFTVTEYTNTMKNGTIAKTAKFRSVCMIAIPSAGLQITISSWKDTCRPRLPFHRTEQKIGQT